MRKTMALAAVIVLLFTAPASYPAAALDPATGKPDDFFGQTKIYTFHLTIADNDFKKMPPKNGPGFGGPGFGRGGFGAPGFPTDADDEERYAKVPAKLRFEGKDWGTLSVRYKGNSTYMSAPTELKRSLKLDFDEIDKTRTFFSMTKLNLNNNALDSTQMREALAYDVFRRAGVAASRTAYAKLFITVPGKYKEEYAGLFTVVEQVDQLFFKDRLGKKVGMLLKPERLNGTPYLGDDWKNYEKRYVSKVTAKSDDAARLIAFIKFINQASDDDFSRHIGEYIDVDQFLKFLAAEVVIVNTDSPLGMNHNYWLTVHPDTKKVVWIPWDMNMAFGGFMADHDLSIRKPSTPGTFPFADRMLANKAFRDRYEQIIRRMLATNVTVERIGEEIRTISGAIRDAIAAEKPPGNPAGFGGDPGFFGRGGFGPPRGFGPGAGEPALPEFVANRVESVLAQLDGKREGTTGRGGFGGRGGPPGFPGGPGFPGPPPGFGPGPQGGPFGRGDRQ